MDGLTRYDIPSQQPGQNVTEHPRGEPALSVGVEKQRLGRQRGSSLSEDEGGQHLPLGIRSPLEQNTTLLKRLSQMLPEFGNLRGRMSSHHIHRPDHASRWSRG